MTTADHCPRCGADVFIDSVTENLAGFTAKCADGHHLFYWDLKSTPVSIPDRAAFRRSGTTFLLGERGDAFKGSPLKAERPADEPSCAHWWQYGGKCYWCGKERNE